MSSKVDYFGYTVFDGCLDDDNNIEWGDTGNGYYIYGSKGDKYYFIKKNKNITLPRSDDFESEASYEINLTKAKRLEKKQLKLAKLMNDLTPEKDHILIEEDHFWDTNDRKFVTVTRYLGGAISDLEEITNSSVEIKRDLFIKMAVLLKKLHDRGVIHGDLKESNFMFVKKDGYYIPFIIDFDSSYDQEFIPRLEDGIPYTESYQSPEIEYVNNNEIEETDSYLTSKTDVFTLGLIFHKLFTGNFLGGRDNTLAYLLCSSKDGYKIPFDKKTDEIIGKNCEMNYESLFNWMLYIDFEKRPTMDQVIDVLNDELEIDSEFILGNIPDKFDVLWSRHEYIANYNKDKLKENGITRFKKYYDKICKYKIKRGDREEILTIDDLLEKGYLDKKDVELDETWPEDNIEYVSMDILRDNNVISIEKSVYMGKHRYIVKMKDGMCINCSFNGLINRGYAKPIIKESFSKFGDPLPEDSDFKYASDKEFERLEVESIETININGVNLYCVKYKNLSPKYFNPSKMKMCGLLIKK